MRSLATVALALAAACAWAADPQDLPKRTDPDLWNHLRNGNCPEAVRRLNEQLRQPDAELLLLTGAMFENGVCVKRDWDRAIGKYVQSSQMGSQAARMRLSAGYLDPVNGVDLASAMWWLHQAPVALPQACRVAGFQPTMEPEAFVAVLQTWPASLTRACAYAGAVIGGTLGDPYYPAAAHRANEEGRVQLRYEPGEGRFHARLMPVDDGAAIEERRWRVGDAPTGKSDLLSYVHDASLNAARRYRDVPAIDPAWVINIELQFRIVP